MNDFKLYFEEELRSKTRQDYYPNGQLQSEEWWIGNKLLHRTDGPAYQKYYPNGQLEYRGWWVNDNRHRIGGPAMESWDENGQRIESEEKYWLHGYHFSKTSYWKRIFEMVAQGKIRNPIDVEVDGLTAII